MSDRKQRQEELQELSEQILFMAKNRILVNMRFMEPAMNRLAFCAGPDRETESGTLVKRDKPREGRGFAVDGRHFYYSPESCIRAYRKERTLPARIYLHGILHCVFRHFSIGQELERQRWDLSCDIAVEGMMDDWDLECVRTDYRQERILICTRIKKEIPLFSAECIYDYLGKEEVSTQEKNKLRRLFALDSHEKWYQTTEKEKTCMEALDVWEAAGEAKGDGRIEADWEEISKKIQMELETFSSGRTDESGSMVQALRELNRERYDYGQFLRRFAVPGERMQISDEEFDYLFYTYGLTLYGNLPLVEPLEYKEVKAVKSLVIAIDTSGSVSGETVQKFVEKTYNILGQQKHFFEKMDLHIIQCDAKVQTDVKISSLQEFGVFLENLSLHGFGGTDFRPVFSYVDDMVREGKIPRLKGLIYFTDGDGIYPKKKPFYQTAFVFLKKPGESAPEVPEWAIRLILQEKELLRA